MLTYAEQIALHKIEDGINERLRKLKYCKAPSQAYRDCVYEELRTEQSRQHSIRAEHMPTIAIIGSKRA